LTERETLFTFFLRSDNASKSQIDDLGTQTNGLENDISELEKDRDIKAPLVSIGVDIRKRFMVQAVATRASIDGYLREPSEKELLQVGNSAAHKPDSMADYALLSAGYLSGEEYGWWFVCVYDNSHVGWNGLDPKVIKLMDSQVMYNLTRSSNYAGSEADPAEALLLINTLAGMMGELGSEHATTLSYELECLVERISVRSR